MDGYGLEDLRKIFEGHAYEYSNSPKYKEDDFNLAMALKNIVEELMMLKNADKIDPES